MLQLNIDHDAANGASVPVRWCLDRDALRELQLDKNQWLFLLLVVVLRNGNRWNEVARHLVPLNKMIHFFRLHNPGEHRIIGVVLDDGDSHDYEFQAYDVLAEKYTRKGRSFLIDGWSSKLEEMLFRQDEMVGAAAEIGVVVPDSAFAKLPPAWEAAWVNFFRSREPVDQCDYRRRRIFAYTIQPVWFLAKIFVGLPFRWLLALGCLIGGVWDLDWITLINPFGKQTTDLWYFAEKQNNRWKWFVWILRGRPAPPEPLSHQERMEEEQRKREEALKERLAYYGKASCEYSKIPVKDLVSGTDKLVLAIAELKGKACKPFPR